ncbi:DUF2752 domain-containing protein [Mucilaginibacter terrae]|uniref:DUF2752 domain-containing protein n=1 Tax=Mucilaginibacter terrae TaxID=1955052 RepID=A0ABU3GZQ4_9SPHI|nr:DUF2752 domain-containing protein [Mucilaginibacter terrae]MDT3405258.1 hypothetical protein [Mucilaginibacter terrae]
MLSIVFCSHLINFKWLQNFLIPCLFKNFTGFDCPFCGLQRSVVALLEGDLVASFKYQPATILLLLALLLSASGQRLQFNNKRLVKRVVYSLTTVCFLAFYLYKIIPALN